MSSRGSTPPHRATFRFYAELNDFLSEPHRQQDLVYTFHVAPSVKDAIESFDVPHVEIDVILVNGSSVGFDYRLAPGDRVTVYPVFETLDVSPIVRLSGRPLRKPAFVADVHLRKLARLLRLLGFDVFYESATDDAELVLISVREQRILLTRDRALLRHGRLTHGYWIRSVDPIEQASEVIRRFDLTSSAKPFTRCTACNGTLRPVDKEDMIARIPPKTAVWIDDYHVCTACSNLYWQGTHHARLHAVVGRLLEGPVKERL